MKTRRIYQPSDVVYLLTWQQLQSGDIILTAGHGFSSFLIKFFTRCRFTHAAIYADAGSILESTCHYSFARNPQRMPFDSVGDVVVMRFKGGLSATQMGTILTQIRSHMLAPYSIMRAITSILGAIGFLLRLIVRITPLRFLFGCQYCSHLVADGYLAAGIELVNRDGDCSPAKLFRSKKLVQVSGLLHSATPEEIGILNSEDLVAIGRSRISGFLNKVCLVSFVHLFYLKDLNSVRELIDRHPYLDKVIAHWFIKSRYPTVGRKDYSANPYRYYQNNLRALGLSNLELMAFVKTEIAFSEPLIARYLSEYKKSKALYTLSGFRYDRINYLICRSNLIQRLRSLDVFAAELKRNGLQSSLAFHRLSIAALGIRMTGIR